jgi:signal transduction histidine kinase/CheY-like chemotaxis protein
MACSFHESKACSSGSVHHNPQVVVLAGSPGFESTNTAYKVHTALKTTNNEWEICIAYCTDSSCLEWFPWAICATIAVSLFISCLVYTIFLQKQRHGDAIEEKSRQMIEAAKRSAKNERELNDFIAHEVRNPISAALSACSFVSCAINETDPLMGVEARTMVLQDVKIIESSLKYANDLLHSMLDLNRGNTEITVRTLPTDIKRDILEPVASMIMIDRRDQGFEVFVECNPSSLVVAVDRLRLKQIVLNLARNSSRFVNAGGFVCLRASAMVHDHSRLQHSSATPSMGGIVISVEDSGPGVPKEKRPQLFVKYQKSLEELNEGAGIGLSLCRKLLGFMDGTISLDETYDSGLPNLPGAKFDVELPCEFIRFKMKKKTSKRDSMADSDTTVSASASLPASVCVQDEQLPKEMTVLFVDDDNVLRKLFARSLKRIRPGWTIYEANSGEMALELSAENGGSFFDMIFLDQYMCSALVGTETARHLREQGVSSLICGLSANDIRDEFKRCGADHFMNKPFPCEPKALTEAMLHLLLSDRTV